MQRNGKLTILIFLIITTVLVWMRKDGNIPVASSASTSDTADQIMPGNKMVARRRTEFTGWGKDPFMRRQKEKKKEHRNNISNLKLVAILWDDKGASAFINDSIVHVGDRISDMIVKQIEQQKVILTDGTEEFILRLQDL